MLMNRDRDYKWRELCRAAAIEQDARKLMELVAEIIKELDKRDRRVKILGREQELRRKLLWD